MMLRDQGLLAGLERKNGWTVAEHAGERGPDGMQRLLWTTVWTSRAFAMICAAMWWSTWVTRGAVLSVDETGFLKKGRRLAGVQRQYSGTAGRTENCQIGTFLASRLPKITSTQVEGVKAGELERHA